MTDPGREARLDALAEEAARLAREGEAGAAVERAGVDEAQRSGRPIGRQPTSGGDGAPDDVVADVDPADRPGYYGQPVVKPPVWTWEVPVYFLVGGMAGMMPLLGMTLVVATRDGFPLTPWLLAAVATILAPLLLVSDLGRPRRFLSMLRVLKWRSPMSVGVWTLVVFSGAVWGTVGWAALIRIAPGPPVPYMPAAQSYGLLALLLLGVLSGLVLATYTGVLLAVTTIPVWSRHRTLLPIHFGLSALGAAAALLLLLGSPAPLVLWRVLAAAAVGEGLIALWLETRRGRVDQPLHRGRSGRLIRTSGLLSGALTLVLLGLGATRAGALVFLVGALVGRFGWVAAGRASARDPRSTLA